MSVQDLILKHQSPVQVFAPGMIFDLSFSTTGVFDATGKCSVVRNGGQIVTAPTPKRGSGSYSQTGVAGTGLVISGAEPLDPYYDVYTIQSWVIPKSSSAQLHVCSPLGANTYFLRWFNQWYSGNNNGYILNVNMPLTVDVPVHMAMSSDGTNCRMYINGMLYLSSSGKMLSETITTWEVGSFQSASLSNTAILQSLSVEKGRAQSTNFTPI